MSEELPGTCVEILGKQYQIRCPQSEINSLQRAAEYLESKMRSLRESGILNIDKVAVITALNVIHQLQTIEQQKHHYVETVNKKLVDLQNKVELALANTTIMELQSAD